MAPFSTMSFLLLLFSCVMLCGAAKPKFQPLKAVRYVIPVGKVVRMKCKLVDVTGVTMKWLRDGTVIEANKENRFRIKNSKVSVFRIRDTKKEDAGEYECQAHNEFGTVSRKMNLIVTGTKQVLGKPGEGPPWFVKPWRTQIQFLAWPAFNDMKLKCEADGARPLTYIWLKDNKPFHSRHLDPNINTSRWFLRIKTAVPSDDGTYTCIVSNRLGNISRSYKMNVLEKPRSRPILSRGFPKNKTVKIGSNVTFQCLELSTTTLTDYRWLKWFKPPTKSFDSSLYDKPFENSSQYRLISDSQYVSFRLKNKEADYGGRVILKNVSKEDAGMYTCLVSNHIGSSYRSAFLIIEDSDLQFLPSVHRPSSINIPGTHTLSLNCNATGDPKPSVTWLKNGKTLDHKSVVTSDFTLRLKKLVPEHSGDYSCNVSNSRGSISHTFNVKIKEQLFARPIILPSVNKTIKFGERYEMKCTVISEEPLTVYWVKKVGTKSKVVLGEKTPVKLDQYIYSYSYVILKATTGDSGIYWCIANNNFGISRRKFKLGVEV